MNWKYHCDEFREILKRNDDDEDEEGSVENTKKELLPLLRSNSMFARLRPGVLEALEKSKAFHTFNQALGEVYDYADDNRIWLGL